MTATQPPGQQEFKVVLPEPWPDLEGVPRAPSAASLARSVNGARHPVLREGTVPSTAPVPSPHLLYLAKSAKPEVEESIQFRGPQGRVKTDEMDRPSKSPPTVNTKESRT